ncbi:hypothetical protein TNCV_3835591 [Trichonephila clavipes]|nr:hypothetical protein TNCV_3835591 [Trichonephila clavipes]
MPRRLMLPHDNSRTHTAAETRELLDQFGWEISDHPFYCPDLAFCDRYLFPNLKKFLGSKRFESVEELRNALTTWPNANEIKKYNMAILKLLNRYDKCLNVESDCVEK